MIKKLLAFLIIFLFFEASIVSSIGNIVEDVPADYNPIKSFDNSKGLLSCDHLAYVGGLGPDCSFWEFILSDPGNMTCICGEGDFGGRSYLSCGAWTTNGVILGCGYGTGVLYVFYPETCEMLSIGGGGTELHGLSMDPTTGKLYGAATSELYEIDTVTGEQMYIGGYGSGPNFMSGIAFDSDGTLYGWDLGNDKLWTIDTSTGEATEFTPLGIDLKYATDGDFCRVDDILYLATYINASNNICYLYECDKNTGNCTFVGQFADCDEVHMFVIPWNFRPYVPSNPYPPGDFPVPIDVNLSWDGGDPDPKDSVTYDVWFGTNHVLSLIATVGPYPANQTRIHFNPGTLVYFEKYIWQIVARDNYGVSTPGPIWSFKTGINFTEYEIEIDGPTFGKPGITYCYNISIVGYDDGSLKLLIDWDDGTQQNEWYEPGHNITVCYCWGEEGTYVIRALAIDQYGEIFAEGKLQVTIPRIRISANLLFLPFLQQFPLLERLLNLVR